MATSPLAKSSDPFPMLTEFNKNHIPTATLSPLSSPKSESDESVVDIPVIQEFGTESLTMPKTTTKEGQQSLTGSNISSVLVEWQPPQQMKKDDGFKMWAKKQSGSTEGEDLVNLEKDYLNLAKLAKAAKQSGTDVE